MTKLSIRDYITWAITILVTFVILMFIGSGGEPQPISEQTRQIITLYRFVFVSGMMVSAIFIGSLFWIAVRFWDRSQKIEIE